MKNSPFAFNGEPGEIEVIHPNPASLEIVRLFLGKHETLTADERKEILAVIKYLNTPLFIHKGRGAHSER